MTDQKPREIAVRLLAQCAVATAFTEERFDEAMRKNALSAPDRSLCQELVFGCVRWRATLDWLMEARTEARQQKPALRALVHLGLYQMLWLSRIPDHAAVHETVELAKQLGYGPQAGFVNAILRSVAREKETLRKQLVDLKQSNPALGYSHPEWLTNRWLQRWGDDDARRLLEWNNTPPGSFARVNTLKTDATKLIELWRTENVDYDFFRRDWIPENLAFQLKSHPPLAALPSFRQGCFYVQDPSTLLAVNRLRPQSGDRVLDLCAAPGGKTTYIAQILKNQGLVVASDSSPDRLKLLTENCRRLGINSIETADAAKLESYGAGWFDRVLIDAPCSNTGVLRRRVDLRWRLRESELKRLAAIQLDLLRRGANCLKRDGTLIYSTCSLEAEENEQVVQAFLAETAGFVLETERNLMPVQDGVDGAYVASFRRQETAA